MTGREIFKIWAPRESKWTDWVRPVPFVAISDSCRASRAMDFVVPSIDYLDRVETNTAIILDLPDCDSIKEGLALAKLGFRPIPLYNGTCEQAGAMALVDNHVITSALVWGASELNKLDIPVNAPPAFLVDSNRAHRFKMNVSVFDNSWDLYNQDMPSAEYFMNNGINKIIVRGETIQKDLARILYDFQKKGIVILFTNGYEKPSMNKIKKPPGKYK